MNKSMILYTRKNEIKIVKRHNMNNLPINAWSNTAKANVKVIKKLDAKKPNTVKNVGKPCFCLVLTLFIVLFEVNLILIEIRYYTISQTNIK